MGQFDWISFLRANGIHFITSGKNVKKGEINCKCPWCGPADPSEHLGLNPDGRFACWRNREHRGGNPAKVVQALKGCTWSEACEIAGSNEQIPGPESLHDIETQAKDLDQIARDKYYSKVKLPKEFEHLSRDHMKMFRSYLERRKFVKLDALCAYYNLRGCLTGKWAKRLILPFYHYNGGLVGWQGRTIGDRGLRYLTHPDSDVTKRFLFNRGPALTGGDTLVIVEGPIDCIKVDFYGKREGIRSVATLGTSYTDAQVAQLFKLAPKYVNLVILYDPLALAEAMGLASRLSMFNPIVGAIPEGREDPGDLEPAEVVPAIKSCLR